MFLFTTKNMIMNFKSTQLTLLCVLAGGLQLNAQLLTHDFRPEKPDNRQLTNTARTTASPVLKAMAGYDLTSGTGIMRDSFHYTYPPGRSDGDQGLLFLSAVRYRRPDVDLKPATYTTQTFNGDGQVASTLVRSWNESSGDWDTSTYTINNYNPGTGYLLQSVTTEWRSGVVFSTLTAYYTRSSKGRLLTKKTTFTVPSEPAYDYTDSSYCVYDATGDLCLSQTMQRWDPASLSWQYWDRYIYGYTATGLQTTTVIQNWNKLSLYWSDLFLYEIGYTSFGREAKVTRTFYSSSGTPEINYECITAYNSDQMIDYKIYSLLDNTSGALYEVRKDQYYYDYTEGIDNTSNRGGSLSIYPVPANNELTLDLQWDKVQKATVSITDLQGRVWQQWALPAVQQYNEKVVLHNLPSGNYVLRIGGSENARVTQSFTVVR
jgi:hypothetical protein